MLNHVDSLILQLEQIHGRSLKVEEKDDVDTWQRGRNLAHVVNSPGWESVVDLLRGYAQRFGDELLATNPADHDAVLAKHAIAHAASQIYNIFLEDVERSIQASHQTPAIMASVTGPTPPESL